MMHDIEASILALRILADRAYYIMQDVEEDFFHNTDWPKDKSKWCYMAHMFPRTASKAGAVGDAIAELRKTLDEIEASMQNGGAAA